MKGARVLLLSRYGSKGASSRVRYLQYLPYLKKAKIDVVVSPLFSNQYLELLYAGRPVLKEAITGYAKRLNRLLSVNDYNLLILEKELFPFLPALGERILKLINVPYIVDYDDALFHRYDQSNSILVRKLLSRKIDIVMKNASVVVAGNDYLAERARQVGARSVEVIPTVVDIDRYPTRSEATSSASLTIGWIGTPKTSKYLKPYIPVFERLVRRFGVNVVAVGAADDDFQHSPITVWRWSEETEVSSIQKFDIGIMPLTDSPWEKGKCGYKLIQYMASGIPVVATPIGVNTELVTEGGTGFLAETEEEWSICLEKLIRMTPEARRKMGEFGRQMVVERYSVQAQAPRIIAIIKKWAMKSQ